MTGVGWPSCLLAQLVDLLPRWSWNAIFALGMLAPFAGYLICLAMRRLVPWKSAAVILFYAFSVPLGLRVVRAGAENTLMVAAFLLLKPVGIILGIALTARTAQSDQRRGFEVGPKR